MARALASIPLFLLPRASSRALCAAPSLLSRSPAAEEVPLAARRLGKTDSLGSAAADSGPARRHKRTKAWSRDRSIMAGIGAEIVSAGAPVLREVSWQAFARCRPGGRLCPQSARRPGPHRPLCPLPLPLCCPQPAEEVPESMLGTQELRDLVERMIETMRAAPGVGLAAPQIGVPLQASGCGLGHEGVGLGAA